MGTGSEGDIELVATDIGLRPAQLFDAVAIEGHGRCAVAGADGLGVVAIGSLAGEELQGQLLLLRLLECREIPLVVEGPLFAGCLHDRQPRVVGEPEFVAVLHAPDGVLRDVLLRPSPVGGVVEGQFVGTLLFDHPAISSVLWRCGAWIRRPVSVRRLMARSMNGACSYMTSLIGSSWLSCMVRSGWTEVREGGCALDRPSVGENIIPVDWSEITKPGGRCQGIYVLFFRHCG